MAITLKYQSRNIDRNDGGTVTSLTWTGPRDEIESFAGEEDPGAVSDYGTLDSIRIYQDGGAIWACERRYRVNQNGNYTNKPTQVYGKKSATLHGSMLSLPLESHKKYLTQWNYYLFAAPGVTAVPDWWATAKDAILTEAQSQNYAWVRSLGETPVTGNKRWRVLKEPKYPGVTSYDVAVYTVTETARFGSAKSAGTMVQKCLNKLGAPNETFGNTGGDWKCDDATISYNGGDWYATMTWTRSGDDSGWNKEIYGGLN